MIPNRDKAKGQAPIEFTSYLIVRFFIIIIEGDRHFPGWKSAQNSKGAAGRFTPTGQLNTEFLFEVPVYLYTRINPLRDEALRHAAGLNSGHYLCRGAKFLISQLRDRLMTPIQVIVNHTATPENHGPIVNITYAILSKQRLYLSEQLNIAFAGRSSIDCVHLKAKP